ncbi:alpha/beta hydrolase [Sphingobium amiense]|uniref:Alpha/beta hydrolase n=1 Tax=Sphingobium amiense TaxID=135719 RepID=A0A494VYQ4_9SPHN|nr:alpha/beta hydrolase [Sphingobium amiense]BBD97011.1 alpha/beta hydrolase [Sphingobium amiense]
MTDTQAFTEHLITREQGKLYARDYAGAGPAFVMMHGFPDHLGIYDALVPHLVAAGRRVVTFDFLGFGKSDKPAGATYTFADQSDDLEAVISQLDLGAIVPVAHDSSGPTGINFALDNPDKVAELVILNSGYDDAKPILWPELITLFATESLSALAMAFATDPAQFGWLLGWQQTRFTVLQPPEQAAGFRREIGQLIADNFIQQPSSGPAFVQLVAQFFPELARNTERLPELGGLTMPVKVIWGEFDPYITTEVGRDRASHFKNARLTLLPAGHWLQSDMPEAVAKEMLA